MHTWKKNEKCSWSSKEAANHYIPYVTLPALCFTLLVEGSHWKGLTVHTSEWGFKKFTLEEFFYACTVDIVAGQFFVVLLKAEYLAASVVPSKQMPVQPTCDNQLISADTDKFHLEVERNTSSREEPLHCKFCESEGETQDREIDQKATLQRE